MEEISLDQALRRRRTRREFATRAVPLEAVRSLLWAAQGITGEEGRRTAPSAHALHPLRLLLVAGDIEGLEPGVHAVAGDGDTLTPAIRGDRRAALQAAALDEQPWIGRAAGMITICADLAAACRHFAEQPPYGARGERYTYIEAGAAAQNVLLAAETLGLACVLVAGFRDEATAEVLGLEAPVAPVLHLCFGWPADR